MERIYFTLGKGGDPQVPTRGYEGDAGWDLYVSETKVVPANQLVDLRTHIHVALPRGYYGRITTRSSTFRRHGLVVSEGIIDNGWRGELAIAVWNPGNHDVPVMVGDRLAQLLIHRIHDFKWVETETLPVSERGGRGFGSTGR